MAILSLFKACQALLTPLAPLLLARKDNGSRFVLHC